MTQTGALIYINRAACTAQSIIYFKMKTMRKKAKNTNGYTEKHAQSYIVYSIESWG